LIRKVKFKYISSIIYLILYTIYILQKLLWTSILSQDDFRGDFGIMGGGFGVNLRGGDFRVIFPVLKKNCTEKIAF